MTDLYNFDHLSLSERIDSTLIHGSFIMERPFRDYRTELYYLNSYFVEVLYNNVDNVIIGIARLPEKAVFQKYTDHISLKALF